MHCIKLKLVKTINNMDTKEYNEYNEGGACHKISIIIVVFIAFHA